MVMLFAIVFALVTIGVAIASIILDARYQRRCRKYPPCIVSNEFINEPIGGNR